MEPRARAAKNLGKMTFSNNELTQLLYAHGDVKNPNPETVKVLDEIATDFMQSLSFEATRVANYAGRQKVKLEDFTFAFRKNPSLIGRVLETIEKKTEIEQARKIIDASEQSIMKNASLEDGEGRKAGKKGKEVEVEEELGEADDDEDGYIVKKK